MSRAHPRPPMRKKRAGKIIVGFWRGGFFPKVLSNVHDRPAGHQPRLQHALRLPADRDQDHPARQFAQHQVGPRGAALHAHRDHVSNSSHFTLSTLRFSSSSSRTSWWECRKGLIWGSFTFTAIVSSQSYQETKRTRSTVIFCPAPNQRFDVHLSAQSHAGERRAHLPGPSVVVGGEAGSLCPREAAPSAGRRDFPEAGGVREGRLAFEKIDATHQKFYPRKLVEQMFRSSVFYLSLKLKKTKNPKVLKVRTTCLHLRHVLSGATA